ncbi:MAG: hypothetical protein ACI396_04115 [Acutalibacteraceae bacterium]
MQIKYAKKLLKNNLCAAILCVITPFIMYMVIKSAEYAVRRYFYPHYHAAVREIIILLCIITLHFVLIYPLKFAKKLCFYNNCEQKSIPLCGAFSCYGSNHSFFLAAFTVLCKKIITFILCGIMIIPTFWVVQLTFIKNFAVYWQIAAVIIAIAAVFMSAVIVYSLFLTEYIAVQTGKNPFYSAFMSMKLMRKNRSKLLLLQLKLVPYWLLCLCIIPIIYVLPLYEQTTALFAHDIIYSSPCFSQAS